MAKYASDIFSTSLYQTTIQWKRSKSRNIPYFVPYFKTGVRLNQNLKGTPSATKRLNFQMGGKNR